MKHTRIFLISLIIAIFFSGVFYTIHYPKDSDFETYDSFIAIMQMTAVIFSGVLGLLIFIAIMSMSYAVISMKSKLKNCWKAVISSVLICVFMASFFGSLRIVGLFSGHGDAQDYEYAHSDKVEPPIVISDPIEFQINQNSTVAVPDSNNRVYITIGQIDGGQAIASLEWDDGAIIVIARTLREGSKLSFKAEGHSYTIELKELVDDLDGKKFARFEISPVNTEAVQKPLISQEKEISSHRDVRISDSMLTDIIKISTGSSSHHNLALKSDGSVVGWGSNQFGQIDCPRGNDFIDIAAGNGHSLALKSDGSIIGWGYSYWGQADAPDGNDFIAISACSNHSLALRTDGSLIGWGSNRFGQIDVPQGNDFVAIAAGWFSCLALKEDGSIVGWGSRPFTGAKPPENKDFIAISAGHNNALALKSDGCIVRWGSFLSQNPSDPPKGNDFTAISIGKNHCLALKKDGSIVGWGDNDKGEASPPESNDFIDIGTGWGHSIGLKADGTVVGWGKNWVGQAEPKN